MQDSLFYLSYFRWQDFFDILVVAFVIYQLISIIKGTRSVQMVAGLVVLTCIYFFAEVLDLSTLKWIMENLLSSIFLIVIIVFQHDIRRALLRAGKSPFHKREDVAVKELDEIVRALFYLSKRRIGALVVIERESSLADLIESGFRLDARLLKEMLISIFMPVSPLHDGAVIISEGRIEHAGCILPLTQNPYINKKYGTRHRAALGLSEETDAVVLVVSEETQEISIVQQGTLTPIEDELQLVSTLKEVFSSGQNAINWKNWIGR